MSKKLLFNFNREAIQNYTYVKYVGAIITATNTLEKPIKSAILKGSTKYRDIDTGEFLETFEEGRNLELVAVRMPVLTTSNEDGTKTNILTVNEGVELRGVGDVKDELDLLTGEVTKRIGEIVLDGSENWILRSSTYDNVVLFYNGFNICPNGVPISEVKSDRLISQAKFQWITQNEGIYLSVSNEGFFLSLSKARNIDTTDKLKQWLSQNEVTVQYRYSSESIKTVDLSILDQNGNKVSSISSFNDTTHIMASSETIPPIFEGYLATKEVE